MSDWPGDVVSRLCDGARRLVIAAPYIKANALQTVLAEVTSGASLICITRWNLQDLSVGASDIECRTIVKDFGGSFRLHPSLHAKYYLIDDVVLVGSANLTSSGMGWSCQPNLEILCRAGNDFDAHSFQQEMLEDAREISDDEFARWQSINAMAIRSEVPHSVVEPPLDMWHPMTRDPRHLELVYRGQEDEIASFDEQTAARRDLQCLKIPTGLTGDEVRMWATAHLLASAFTNTVIQIHTMDARSATGLIAATYGLSITEARRDMETVQNWLALLVPETLQVKIPESDLLRVPDN